MNCFSAESGESKCIINMYYTIKVNGELEKNSKDCPLLISSTHLIGIDPEWIESPVSIIHECDSDCKLQVKRKRRVIERERVNTNTLVLKHYFRNGLFALNVYCLNTILP